MFFGEKCILVKNKRYYSSILILIKKSKIVLFVFIVSYLSIFFRSLYLNKSLTILSNNKPKLLFSVVFENEVIFINKICRISILKTLKMHKIA